MCKSDPKSGQSLFIYESPPEESKTVSKFVNDDNLPYFGGQNQSEVLAGSTSNYVTQKQFALQEVNMKLPQY